MSRRRGIAEEVVGEPLDLPPFRGLIRPVYNHPGFRAAISDCRSLLGSPGARIVLKGRNTVAVVPLPTTDGSLRNVFVKEFCLVGVDKLKSAVFPSKARRAWWGAAALVERGIPTPSPVVYLERREKGLVAQSCFLSEEVEGAKEVRGLFRELPEVELRGLLRALAGFIISCHCKGILHRDLSDGNILVKQKKGGSWSFWLLDTNRIRIKKKISKRLGIKNLIRLGVPASMQRYFVHAYLGAQDPGWVYFYWYRVNKASFSAFVSLKKALRLRKLARKLRIQ